MDWVYQQQVLSEIPEGYYGFVYNITNILSGRQYIGKKFFYSQKQRQVKGKKKKYNTPYSYKSKMPPPKAFDKWIVKKGLAPRDKGKFKSRKSLSFAIARSVFMNGIKPSLFFTKPFEAAYKRLPEELVEKYGLDALKLFNEQIDQIQKQNG